MFFTSFRLAAEALPDAFEGLSVAAQQTAQSAHQAFSDSFFALMHGDLDSLGDVWKRFLDDILRHISDFLASAAVRELAGFASSLFGIGTGAVASASNGAGSLLGPILSGAAILGVSIYGGYFNGGLGIMLLATLGLLGHADLNGMNGLKTVLSAVLSLISAATFVWAGLIAWEQALVLAAGAVAGGYGGARLGRVLRADLLRGFIVLVGAGMTLAFFTL